VPFARLFVEIDSAMVGFGAYHQNDLGLLDFLCAPSRPSFRRQNFVLIENRIYAIGPQPIGEVEHSILMIEAVVAIANKYPWRCLFQHRKLPKPSSGHFEN
jgi:hypothetical protein